MRLRMLIAMVVVLLPLSCRSQSTGEKTLPLCDISQANVASVSVMTDINGVDFAPYLEMMKQRVKREWYSLVPSTVLKPGCLSIQFKILQNGSVADVHGVSTSGDVGLDRAAFAGILAVDSFPPLPAGFKGDHLDLRFNFSYNLGSDGSHKTQSATPAIDEAALAPIPSVHGSTQDFSQIADSINLAHDKALSTKLQAPSSSPSSYIQILTGRLIHEVDPKYPEEARKNKTQGSVVLEATIEKNGNITDLSIISGDLVLADAAVDAVRGWAFEPYTASGHPIQIRQKLKFNFVAGETIGHLDVQLAPPTLAKGSLTSVRWEGSPGETVYSVGHGVTSPRVIYAPDPAYSEAARKGKYQGTCLLSLIVGPDGRPRDTAVIRALGMGLDEKAVNIVNQWKFQPGTKDGNPVAVYVVIEVAFHLY
jgi:TonB family protein